MGAVNSVTVGHGTAAWALLIVRLTAGLIFVAHGAQKMLGMWGGPGLATMAERMGPLGYLVAIGEFFGGVALIVGLFSRFSAFWLIVIMLGAIVQVHGKNGFFSANSGFEYNLALIGLMLPTLIAGPGALALASMLPTRLRTWLA